MKKPPNSADDPQFHYEIWSGPTKDFFARRQSIYYVENQNSDIDYSYVASDFRFATNVILEKQKDENHVSNWVGPLVHLVRHTTELHTKGLLQAIGWKTRSSFEKHLFSHDIQLIWWTSRDWLVDRNYRITEDIRLAEADWFVENLHAIDPAGDLFRFGTSKQTAYGRHKSYDRIGFDLEYLEQSFHTSCDLISFWNSVLIREIIMAEQGLDADPFFDANDFPREAI